MIKVDKFLFNWDVPSEKDENKLRRCLKDNFGINWATDAKIIKTGDNTICIRSEEKSVEIKIDKDDKKALLRIEDKEYDLLVKVESGNFYIINNRISLGDIYRDIEFIENVREYTTTEDGKAIRIVEIKKIIYPYVVILTQDCDLAQDCKFRLDEKKAVIKY